MKGLQQQSCSRKGSDSQFTGTPCLFTTPKRGTKRDMLPLMDPSFHLVVVESPPVSPKAVADLDDVHLVDNNATTEATTSSSPYAKRRRRVRHVTFADEALVYGSDRTQQEVEQSWFSKDDVAMFKNDRKDIIRALKSVNFCLDLIDTSRHCLRGFEAYFSIEYNKAIKYVRESVANSVFTEQIRQRHLGIQDDEALRMACHSASYWAMSHAIEIGRADAAYVNAHCFV